MASYKFSKKQSKGNNFESTPNRGEMILQSRLFDNLQGTMSNRNLSFSLTAILVDFLKP